MNDSGTTSPDERVSDLVAEWVEHRHSGDELSLEVLCRDEPQFIEEVRAQIERLRQTDWLFDEAEQETLSGTADATTPEVPDGVPALADSLSAEELLNRADELHVLSDKDMADLAKDLSEADGREAARLLIDRKLLTPFQVKNLCRGGGAELVLGDYLLQETIGEGGMGRVYRALHRPMQRVVAVKVIHPRVFGSRDAVARFRREVRAAARLNHPHIVIAHDAGESGGRNYLAMEYVDGVDLASLVQRDGPLPVERAVSCLLQSARALCYAHEEGIIHRDVKPSNLMLDSAGNMKVLDLGLARIADTAREQQQKSAASLTGSGQIMGTVDYLAPEQALDSRQADERSDIYALGCTLYALLHGRPMYDGRSMVGRLLAHQNAPVPSLGAGRGDVPGRLEAVFQRMVAKRPGDRFRNMEEVAAALSAAGDAGARSRRRVGIAVSAAAGTGLLAALIGLIAGEDLSDDAVATVPAMTQRSETGMWEHQGGPGGADRAEPAGPLSSAQPEWLVRYSTRIDENPADVAAYWLRARGYINLQRFRDAITDCDAALRIDPMCRSAFFWRGLARMNLGQHASALDDFRQSLSMREDDDWCLRHLAWILVAGPPELRDAGEARRLAERAVELSRQRNRSSYPRCLAVLGMAHYRLGDLETARQLLEEAIESGAVNRRTLLFDAMCRARLDNRDGAIRRYEQALEHAERDPIGDPERIRVEAAELLAIAETDSPAARAR